MAKQFTLNGAPTSVQENRATTLLTGFLSALYALVSLIAVSAVAVGTMLGSAALLHHLDPSRNFDEFRAFHEPIALGVLLAAASFWVLPPYPWTKGSREVTEESPTASKREVLAD